MKKASISFLLLVLIFSSCNLFNVNTENVKIKTEEQKISVLGVNFTGEMSTFGDIAALSAYGLDIVEDRYKQYVCFYKKTSDYWENTGRLDIGGAWNGANVGLYDSLLITGTYDATKIYKFESGNWVVDTLLTATKSEVDIYGNDVVIASGGNIDFFHYDGYNWINSLSNSSLTYFPKVKLREDMAFIGDYLFNEYRGAIKIFKKNDIWEADGALSTWEVESGDNFAYDLDVSENYIIAGAPAAYYVSRQGTGSAYIFKLSNDEWILDEKISIADTNIYNGFGRSVAISNSYAVIGVSGDNECGERAGAAYLYKKTLSGWTLKTKLIASDAQSGDGFGFKVEISENNDILIASHEAQCIYYFRP